MRIEKAEKSALDLFLK